MGRILIVDDEQNWLKTYKRIFRATDYDTAYASSGTEALKMAVEFKPDIILLDIMMPGVDGYAVCEDLKNKETTKESEVIFVSGRGMLDDRLKAYKLRASDFLVKPFSHDELLAKIELIIEKRHFYLELATTDTLTNIGNRKFFDEKFENIYQLASQYQQTFSIAITDIDHFKKVNDTYGHDVGDFVLKQVADIFKQTLRKTDIIARIGGEEFAVLFQESKKGGIKIALERLRKNIENHVFKKPETEHSLNITISIGFATYPNNSTVKNDLFKKADQALYQAKNNCRNKVVEVG